MSKPHKGKMPKTVKTFGDLCIYLRLSKSPPWSQQELADQIQTRYEEEHSMASTIKRMEYDESTRTKGFFKIFATLLDLPPDQDQFFFVKLLMELQNKTHQIDRDCRV